MPLERLRLEDYLRLLESWSFRPMYILGEGRRKEEREIRFHLNKYKLFSLAEAVRLGRGEKGEGRAREEDGSRRNDPEESTAPCSNYDRQQLTIHFKTAREVCNCSPEKKRSVSEVIGPMHTVDWN